MSLWYPHTLQGDVWWTETKGGKYPNEAFAWVQMPCTQLRHEKQCIQQNSMEVCGIIIIIINEATSRFALLSRPENF